MGFTNSLGMVWAVWTLVHDVGGVESVPDFSKEKFLYLIVEMENWKIKVSAISC